MHFTAVEKEDSDEDNIWDELEMFCSSIDIKKSAPSSKDHELQQKKLETHTIPIAPKEVSHEHHEEDMEIISSQEEEEQLPNQQYTTIVEKNKVKDDFLDQVPSR